MRVVVTSSGADYEAAVDPMFGRCANYLFIDTETDSIELKANPAAGAPSGAGIMAAQYVIEQGAEAVLTGNVGPNAMDVFQATEIPVYSLPASIKTVGEAMLVFNAGQLQPAGGATVGAHRAPQIDNPERDKKIATLAGRARELRQELASILDEIEALEKEN